MRVELRIYKSSWAHGERDYVQTTINKVPTIADAKKLCKAVCKACWGRINSQSIVFAREDAVLMNFSTEGHGGYVLFRADTRQFKDVRHYASSADVNIKFPNTFPTPWSVSPFEEDCEWARLHDVLTTDDWNKVCEEWRKTRVDYSRSAEEAREWLTAHAIRLNDEYNY